jgi:hypothetical protein
MTDMLYLTRLTFLQIQDQAKSGNKRAAHDLSSRPRKKMSLGGRYSRSKFNSPLCAKGNEQEEIESQFGSRQKP